jgi:hypothetical protein
VGTDEADTVEQLRDLPGEPPPIPCDTEGKVPTGGTEGKQPTGKASVYYQQAEKNSPKKRVHPSPSPRQ